MRKRLASILAIAAALLSSTAPAAAEALTVMVSYADWCGPCQVLAPKLDEAEARYDGDLETVYIDFTDLSEENIERQLDRAAPLRAEEFFDGGYLATGFALVLAGGAVVDQITAQMSVDEILAAYRAAAE